MVSLNRCGLSMENSNLKAERLNTAFSGNWRWCLKAGATASAGGESCTTTRTPSRKCNQGSTHLKVKLGTIDFNPASLAVCCFVAHNRDLYCSGDRRWSSVLCFYAATTERGAPWRTLAPITVESMEYFYMHIGGDWRIYG